MVESWAIENASFGTTSNDLSPSLVRTGRTREVDERQLEGVIEAYPLMKHVLTADEVADTVSFLPASAHLNGANLVINAAANVI